MPHVFTLSAPHFGNRALARVPQAAPWWEVKAPTGALADLLGETGGDTVRVIGLSAVGLAIGYAAAYLLFFRGR